MLNQIIRRVLMTLVNRGVNEGINRMTRKGGQGSAGQPMPPMTEADKLQSQRAREMDKRSKDMAKLTRRMR